MLEILLAFHHLRSHPISIVFSFLPMTLSLSYSPRHHVRTLKVLFIPPPLLFYWLLGPITYFSHLSPFQSHCTSLSSTHVSSFPNIAKGSQLASLPLGSSLFPIQKSHLISLKANSSYIFVQRLVWLLSIFLGSDSTYHPIFAVYHTMLQLSKILTFSLTCLMFFQCSASAHIFPSMLLVIS